MSGSFSSSTPQVGTVRIHTEERIAVENYKASAPRSPDRSDSPPPYESPPDYDSLPLEVLMNASRLQNQLSSSHKSSSSSVSGHDVGLVGRNVNGSCVVSIPVDSDSLSNSPKQSAPNIVASNSDNPAVSSVDSESSTVQSVSVTITDV